MATVYLATDRRLDRRVALKVMHPHLAEGTDVVARFRREARSAARLAHPGIVAVLDQGLDGETSYLTMEYVRGRTLRTEISGHGALLLGRALEITESILDALAAAHRAGLVHRDIKPENVLLTTEGRVKVADFGLARAVTEATVASTGTLLGTVAYLSPEIVTSGEADKRTDVYAVGIVLFEMLTGAPPFTGASPIQVAYRHVHEDTPPPSDVVPWLPIDVDELVATLTARDLDQRPQDAAAALTLVKRVRRGLDERALLLRASIAGRPELLTEAEDDEFPPPSQDDGGDETVDVNATTALDRGPGTGTIALHIGSVTGSQEPVKTAQVSSAKAAKPRKRRRGRIALVWLLVLLLLTGGGAAAWYFILGPGSPVTVPTLTGMSLEEATAQLSDLDLLATSETSYNDEVPEGEVISSDPTSGFRLARGENVALVVSLGVEHYPVPTTIGLDQESAEAAIFEAGLDVGEVTTQEDRDVPPGVVLSSFPEAATSVPHTSAVDLVVSSGPRVVTVPSYVGTDAELAATDLMNLLDITEPEITVTQVFSTDVAAGLVVSQQPTADSEVTQGTPAAFEVSKGPELFEVPSVVGKQISEATRLLESAGFEVREENVLGGFFGTVRSQSVAGGEMRQRGAIITLTIV